jgi:hypothetical protein
VVPEIGLSYFSSDPNSPEMTFPASVLQYWMSGRLIFPALVRLPIGRHPDGRG